MGETALTWACINGLSDVALALIKTGESKPEHVDSGETTALIYACAKKMSNVALALIETRRSNPGQISPMNETALLWTCANKLSDVALALIKTGQSKPNHITNNKKDTALTLACSKQMADVALALIETGQSNPGQINRIGETALLWACINGLSDIALELIKTGESKPGHVDSGGTTALIHACSKKMSNVALALIETRRSNPGQINSNDVTALIWACHNGWPDVAMALINTKQAKIAHKARNGHAALFYAEKKNNMQSVVLRLQYLLEQKKYKMPIRHQSLSPLSMAYDVIGLEDVKIKTYLLSDVDNIVIWANNRWFLSNKYAIVNLIETKKDGVVFKDAVVFKCNSASGYLSSENVDDTKEYFRLKSIGILLDFVPMTYIHALLQSDHQYYKLEPTAETLPSVVSYNIYYNHGSWVSGSHCQNGQGGKVYIMRRVKIHSAPTRKSKKEMDQRLNKYQSKEKKEEYGSSIIKQNTLPSLKSLKSKTRKRTIRSL